MSYFITEVWILYDLCENDDDHIYTEIWEILKGLENVKHHYTI